MASVFHIPFFILLSSRGSVILSLLQHSHFFPHRAGPVLKHNKNSKHSATGIQPLLQAHSVLRLNIHYFIQSPHITYLFLQTLLMSLSSLYLFKPTPPESLSDSNNSCYLLSACCMPSTGPPVQEWERLLVSLLQLKTRRHTQEHF